MASSSRKVMICVDGSDIAEKAFTWYVENLWKDGDEVTVVTKPEVNISFSIFKSDDKIKEIQEKFSKSWEDVDKLTAMFGDMMRAKKIKGSAIPISNELKTGDALLQKADEIGANVIVIGTRGLSQIKRTFLGSVSNHVVKHAHCPVVVVRPEGES